MSFSLRLRRNLTQNDTATLPLADEPVAFRPQVGVDAFQVVYATYRNDVIRYCRYRLSTDEDAEDATQEIFLHAYDAFPRWANRGGGIRPWLFSIAHNEVVSRYRATARHPEVGIEAAGALAYQGDSPEQRALDTTELDHVLRLLTQLSDDQRRVMELRLVGLTGAEIAGVLDKKHATVRKLQERAIERLTELRLAEAVPGGVPV